MRIAVAGATGRIGKLAIDAIGRAGHEPVRISRADGVDILTGDGLDEALAGVDSVIDVTNTTAQDEKETVDFFVTGTTTLLAAEQRAGVRHHVLLSIVGIDGVPDNAHYQGKLAQEQTIQRQQAPATIVRATQFFDFPLMIASWTRQGDVVLLPPLLMQPIAPADVADTLLDAALDQPHGRLPDLAGPDPQDLVDMARRCFDARGETPVLVPGWGMPFSTSMAGTVLMPGPDARIAPTTFDEWLAAGGANDA